MKAEDTVESKTNNGLWYYIWGLECTIEVVNGLQVVTQKKQYQKTPTWAGNEPGWSVCSSCCLEKYSFGYFWYRTFLTLIKLSFRYCKVPVKTVSKCWVVAQKWWVIKLLGKIFWQESVRALTASSALSSHILSFALRLLARRRGRLLAGRMGLAVPSPGRCSNSHQPLLTCWGCQVTATHAQHTLVHPHLNSCCHCALWLALCFRVVSSSWSTGAFPSRGLSSQPLWRGPAGLHTAVTFWRHFKLALKQYSRNKIYYYYDLQLGLEQPPPPSILICLVTSAGPCLLLSC